ncbi:MAG: type VI secretion system contractile sheath large subunit [Planctomycetota bacterium]
MAASKKQQVAPSQYAELEQEDLLTQLLDDFKGKDQSERQRARNLLKNWLDDTIDPKLIEKPHARQAISERIAQIDEVLSAQTSAIMHHKEFQALEASWRGLEKLVFDSRTGEHLKIRVLSTSKRELLKDFRTAAEFTETALWKKVYQEEFGIWGGDPFGCIVGDFQFGKGDQDVELLTEISRVAAASHAPFMAAASPDMFGWERFDEMPEPRDLAAIFKKEDPRNTKWLSFRGKEESRFVALTLPGTLGRAPYGPENPADSFTFREDVTGEDHDKYLWCNAAYALAGRLTASFTKHHWCTAIRGPQGGGMVEGLPIHKFKSREGDLAAKCPTEVLIPEDRENELSELGFLAVVNCKNTDYAAFFSGHTVQRPKLFPDAEANANADYSRKLPYLMATSRIAHYLKVICRDKVGQFVSRDDCQDYLNKWISKYVLSMDKATQEQKAERPLRQAQIKVVDDPARPGNFKATVHLRPHSFLESIEVSLRLVAELPEAKG